MRGVSMRVVRRSRHGHRNWHCQLAVRRATRLVAAFAQIYTSAADASVMPQQQQLDGLNSTAAAAAATRTIRTARTSRTARIPATSPRSLRHLCSDAQPVWRQQRWLLRPTRRQLQRAKQRRVHPQTARRAAGVGAEASTRSHPQNRHLATGANSQ